MNAQELLETYGKAAGVVKSYYVEKFIESMVTENVPENYKEFARSEGIDNSTIAKMVESMPRALFDVFDSYELHIEILVMYCYFFYYDDDYDDYDYDYDYNDYNNKDYNDDIDNNNNNNNNNDDEYLY